MRCSFNNNIHPVYFGKKNKKPVNNNALNIGVITPPDKLPNSSLFETYKAQTMPLKTKGGGRKLTSGRLSAFLAFSTMVLSLAAFLPFVRKR